jgi:hypothetical protein
MTKLQTAILDYAQAHPDASARNIARAVGCDASSVWYTRRHYAPGDTAYKLPVRPYEPLPEIGELKRLLGLTETP